MKNVLIITYHFPPDDAIGGIRINALFKYLREYNWHPVILTKKSKNGPRNANNVIETPYFEHDAIKSVKSAIGMDTNKPVNRSSTGENHIDKSLIYSISRFLMLELLAYPDVHKGWYKHAYKNAENIVATQKIDAIISTSSPVISHILAKKLSQQHNIPWIADFRDLWSQNHYTEYTFIRKNRERRLEIKTISKASALTTVSAPLSEKLKELHSYKEVYSVPNGYDPERISDVSCDFNNMFTLTYTGSLYLGKRDPSKLFQAFSELILENKVNPEKIEIRFYGQKENWFDKHVEKYSLNSIVTHYGFIPREESLKAQKESHILLVLLWDNPEEVGVYTGKVFDYLASRRPMITIGPDIENVIKELLDKTSTGYYTSSVEELKEIIKLYYDEYERTGTVAYRGKGIEAYSQKEMARKFAEILNKVSANTE
jgi:hypothetical protein